jgi:hypothetical protein
MEGLCHIFENETLQKRFISKLKLCNENSKFVKELKMFIKQNGILKKPSILKQTCVIQKIGQFISPIKCFTNLRLISKQWKDAIETIRFEMKYIKMKDLFGKELYDSPEIILSTSFAKKIIHGVKHIEFCDEVLFCCFFFATHPNFSTHVKCLFSFVVVLRRQSFTSFFASIF